MELQDRIFSLAAQGLCCSEILMQMTLEDLGRGAEADKDLIKAMGAFCEGLHVGSACGTFCAANSLCYIASENKAAAGGAALDFAAWFKERFGAYNCADLLDGDVSRKMTLCPQIIAESYAKLGEILIKK